ncbi:MAG: ROK family protein [Oscillospiraceae bacterium]|nr:ROK family protein [Oscillospiraceae bacterium]
MNHYIGIDLGGTNIAAGLVSGENKIISKKSVLTRAPRPAEQICNDIVLLCKALVDEAKISMLDIQWIGVASPGIISNRVIKFANNLQFNDVPFADILEKKLNKRVFLQNDANAAAYGELIAGAGVGHDSLVAITLGTGIGGGIVINRKIYDGFNGAGAEIGHMVIYADGKQCSCGKNGCFEIYCSASAIIAQTKEAMEYNHNSVMWELCDGNLENATGKTAFDGMRRFDESSTAVVNKFIENLSIGVLNVITIFQPEIVCIGGGLSKEGDTIIKPLTKLVNDKSLTKSLDKNTQIVTAKLYNDAGIIGAAMLGAQL